VRGWLSLLQLILGAIQFCFKEYTKLVSMPPRARFQKGDRLLARGAPGISSLGGTDDNTSLSGVYPFIMKDKKYECVSDHAMIAMETDFVPGIQ